MKVSSGGSASSRRSVAAASGEPLRVTAMVKAVQPKFQVLDGVGDVLVEGTVGSPPVTLEPGTYTVRVQTSPVQRFEIEVAPGEAEQIQL